MRPARYACCCLWWTHHKLAGPKCPCMSTGRDSYWPRMDAGVSEPTFSHHFSPLEPRIAAAAVDCLRQPQHTTQPCGPALSSSKHSKHAGLDTYLMGCCICSCAEAGRTQARL